MARSLSSLTNNLAKGLYKTKCKKYKSGLQYFMVKDNTLAFKHLGCNNGDIKKLCLMLQKVLYPYE